jgi:hypothetical protein
VAALDVHEETAVINERLRHKGRRQAVEILGDFYDAGKQLDGLPFWWRWLGRRESRSRAMERHRLAIVARTRRGAAVGVLAGLVWSIVIGLPLIATVAWATLDLGWRNSVAMYGAFLALAAILGGLYFGRKIAKLTAKQAAISRDGRWLLASWKDWMVPLLVFAAVLTLNVREFPAAVVMAVVFSVIAGAFVAFLRPAVWPPTPRWAIVLTGLAAGLVPMAGAIAIFVFARDSLQRSPELMALFVGAAAFFSFLSSTRVMALAETTRAQPIGEQPRGAKLHSNADAGCGRPGRAGGDSAARLVVRYSLEAAGLIGHPCGSADCAAGSRVGLFQGEQSERSPAVVRDQGSSRRGGVVRQEGAGRSPSLARAGADVAAVDARHHHRQHRPAGGQSPDWTNHSAPASRSDQRDGDHAV